MCGENFTTKAGFYMLRGKYINTDAKASDAILGRSVLYEDHA